MSRTPLFLAASFLVLAACQPASEPSDELVVEAPPMVVEEVIKETAEEDTVTDLAASGTDSATIEAGAEEEHADDHDAHDHDDDHTDHAEDHDDHDHAGGEAHLHGVSELAISLDADTISVSFEGALANFDLDESLRALADTAPYTDGVIELVGGECTREQSEASIRAIGDHGNLMVDLVFSCASVEDLSAINVTAFGAFSGFEEVNAVILTETGQTARTLTASNTRLDLR